MCTCVRVHRKHGVHVQVKGELSGGSSLLTCESVSPAWSEAHLSPELAALKAVF